MKLRPADAAKGNGRLLYEVNNRGRIMLFANLCAGAAGDLTGCFTGGVATTVRGADRIYVFDKGRIAQNGTYDDLIKAPGPFAEFAKRQLV